MTNSKSRLSDNARASEALRQYLPEPLLDATFSVVLRDDVATKRCLALLSVHVFGLHSAAISNSGQFIMYPDFLAATCTTP
jgi:hypothetical protein